MTHSLTLNTVSLSRDSHSQRSKTTTAQTHMLTMPNTLKTSHLEWGREDLNTGRHPMKQCREMDLRLDCKKNFKLSSKWNKYVIKHCIAKVSHSHYEAKHLNGNVTNFCKCDIVYTPKTQQWMSYREKSCHPYFFLRLPHLKNLFLVLSKLKESLYLQFLFHSFVWHCGFVNSICPQIYSQQQ